VGVSRRREKKGRLRRDARDVPMPVWGYRTVAKRKGAYAAMPVLSVWGYRAVAKRRGAYAAMRPLPFYNAITI